VHEEYNWDGYDVASGRHWDHTFQADLNRLSHASYANLFMLGERFDTYWRETAGSEVPVLGNRGPEGGKRQRSSFTTNRNGYWSGYVVAGDHWTQLQTSMTPAWLQYDDEGELRPDNLFGIDTGLHGNDVVLTFTREATGASATLHHD